MTPEARKLSIEIIKKLAEFAKITGAKHGDSLIQHFATEQAAFAVRWKKLLEDAGSEFESEYRQEYDAK